MFSQHLSKFVNTEPSTAACLRQHLQNWLTYPFVPSHFGPDQIDGSLAVNNRDEIISSSLWTNRVIVMDSSGKKIYSYSHEKLSHPFGLDVNFSGNIFVAGQFSNNIHVLTPRAELMKIFDVASPRFIRFKENSYVCLVMSGNSTKVYEFQEDL